VLWKKELESMFWESFGLLLLLIMLKTLFEFRLFLIRLSNWELAWNLFASLFLDSSSFSILKLWFEFIIFFSFW
jgi:hypothetical protein